MRRLSRAACALLVAGAVASEVPGQSETCTTKDCRAPASGGALLQARAEKHMEAALKEAAEDEGSVQVNELMYNGARIRIPSNSYVALTGRGRWVITVKKGCSSADISKMSATLPSDTRSVYEGQPDKGGLCAFIMEGTLDGVKKMLATNTWSSPPLIEADVETSTETPTSLLEQGQFPPGFPPPCPAFPWGLDRIDDRSGLDGSYEPAVGAKQGEGVNIYVVDSGIAFDHPEFEGRAIPAMECHTGTTVLCDPSNKSCALDGFFHGTHCAGIAAGKTLGTAKKANLIAVKVMDSAGKSSFAKMLEGIDWVVANAKKPAIISMSMYGKGENEAYIAAIDNAVAKGIPVIVAAGNKGDTDHPDACHYTPGYVPKAITVGATTSPEASGKDARWSKSNYGSCVDIFAPGDQVCGPAVFGSMVTQFPCSGTSMATPHVAGVSALLLAKNPNMTPEEILNTLKTSGTKGVIDDVKEGSPNLMLYAGAP